MEENKRYERIYFVGIGGIGMSALARIFHKQGRLVCGYDLTPSRITDALQAEGIAVHFDDLGDKLEEKGFTPEDTAVVYTPAVPDSLGELNYFRSNGFSVIKRSEALSLALEGYKQAAVAGTHGKTTTSTMLAHILHNSRLGCFAVLGGISVNSGTNFIIDEGAEWAVTEADEYDRSFLKLSPHVAIVTAVSPDHLDIYETAEGYHRGFLDFLQRIDRNGTLIYKKGVFADDELPQCKTYSYSVGEPSDIYSDDIRIEDEELCFDWHFPALGLNMERVILATPIEINVQNATAAMGAAVLAGVKPDEIRASLLSFKGVKRRFEVVLNDENHVLIDDYAHHPDEIAAAASSIKKLYPNDRVMAIFQPHLYSRTKDFYKGFAQALSAFDEVVLLPIYPAREEPIEGVTSQLVYDALDIPNKYLVERDRLVGFIGQHASLPRVIMTVGAGNIDRLVAPLAKKLRSM